MPHNANVARTEYENAKSALQGVMNDLNSTEAEAGAASAALQELAMNFAAASMDDFDDRTEFLNSIVEQLKHVIEASGDNVAGVDPDDLVDNVRAIGEIADRVKVLLE